MNEKIEVKEDFVQIPREQFEFMESQIQRIEDAVGTLEGNNFGVDAEHPAIFHVERASVGKQIIFADIRTELETEIFLIDLFSHEVKTLHRLDPKTPYAEIGALLAFDKKMYEAEAFVHAISEGISEIIFDQF